MIRVRIPVCQVGVTPHPIHILYVAITYFMNGLQTLAVSSGTQQMDESRDENKDEDDTIIYSVSYDV